MLLYWCGIGEFNGGLAAGTVLGDVIVIDLANLFSPKLYLKAVGKLFILGFSCELRLMIDEALLKNK